MNKELDGLTFEPKEKLEEGDVFLWRSGQTGKHSIHTFHSDAGYGAKTYTEFDKESECSLIVNYSGVCGVLVVTPKP